MGTYIIIRTIIIRKIGIRITDQWTVTWHGMASQHLFLMRGGEGGRERERERERREGESAKRERGEREREREREKEREIRHTESPLSNPSPHSLPWRPAPQTPGLRVGGVLEREKVRGRDGWRERERERN